MTASTLIKVLLLTSLLVLKDGVLSGALKRHDKQRGPGSQQRDGCQL